MPIEVSDARKIGENASRGGTEIKGIAEIRASRESGNGTKRRGTKNITIRM
jgi:hypothetical protein